MIGTADDFDREQKEILEEVREIRDRYRGQGMAWNRFRGIATLNVVKRCLKKHMPKSKRVVKLGWVEGCPMEFDLIIVRRDAKPIGLTPAYGRNDVFCTVEVKSAGVFWKLDEMGEELKKLRQKAMETQKPWFYLTLWESEKSCLLYTSDAADE